MYPSIARLMITAAALAAFSGAVLAMDALPARAGGGGGCKDATASEGAGDSVTLKDFCFQPTVLRVAEGTTVTFANVDDAVHELRGLQWGANSALTRGTSVSQRFDAPGTYPYSCPLHYGMVGVVVVGDGANGNSVAAAVRPVTGVVRETAALAVAPAPAPATSTSIASTARPDLSPIAWTGFGAVFALIVTVSVLGPVAYVGLRRR